MSKKCVFLSSITTVTTCIKTVTVQYPLSRQKWSCWFGKVYNVYHYLPFIVLHIIYIKPLVQMFSSDSLLRYIQTFPWAVIEVWRMLNSIQYNKIQRGIRPQRVRKWNLRGYARKQTSGSLKKESIEGRAIDENKSIRCWGSADSTGNTYCT